MHLEEEDGFRLQPPFDAKSPIELLYEAGNSLRLKAALHDNLENLSGNTRGIDKARRVDVLGAKKDEHSPANLEEIALGVEKDNIFIRVVCLLDRQPGVERGVTHPLGPADDVLYVNVTAMGLPFRLADRLGAVALDKGEKPLSVQRMTSLRHAQKNRYSPSSSKHRRSADGGRDRTERFREDRES